MFPAVEIDTTFSRLPRAGTIERWAAATPASFRFSVKLSRQITHVARLARPGAALREFFGRVERLGAKLGLVLVQLPRALAFDRARADAFFKALRRVHEGPVALEPRHASWFSDPGPARLLRHHRIARVAADPAVVPAAAEPGGWDGLVYFRLHGSPRMYRDAYPPEFLDRLARRLREAGRHAETWCIFDNTAEGAATGDALAVLAALRSG